MRKIMLTLLCVAALVSFSSACGDDDERDDGSSETLSLDAFSQEYTARTCEMFFSCCTQDEIAGMGARFDTEEECLTLLRKQLEQSGKKAVDEGRSIYHADKAAKCLQDMQALTCADGILAFDSAACDETLEGTVEEGSECASTEECVAGGVCEGIESDGEGAITKLGKCEARGGVGDACESPADCGDDVYCSAEGECAVRKDVGEACEISDECESYYCDATDEGDKECFEAPTEQMICTGE